MNLFSREGYWRRFGSPSTPVDQGLYRQYDPLTGADDDWDIVPLAAIPQTLSKMSPGESSPTGKSGVSYILHDVAETDYDSAIGSTLIFDPDPIYAGTALVTTSTVNPFDTITGRETGGKGFQLPGIKWHP